MLLRKAVPVLALTLAAILAAPAAATAAPATDQPVKATPAGAAASLDAATGPGTLAAATPVIVVGGLSGVAVVYEPLAARLRADGHRVWIYQLPNLGLGDIAASANSLRGFVGQVRSATGASRIDLVAHSEGGLVSRYYIKNLGGGDVIGRYVSLGTPQYGTYVANIVAFLGLGSCAGVVACQQMTIGSSFLAALNAGDDTPGAVRWTTVRTWQDELVRPVDNAMLADGATNVLIQSKCPLRVVGHLGLVVDGTTYSVIRQALNDQPINPNCLAL